MIIKFLVILVSFVTLVATSSTADSPAIENQGAKNIELHGGKRGMVPFPHRQHQKNLADCQICHSTFPQEPGAIEELKSQGKLKKKYIMNKLCTKCHKKKKKAGLPSGPTKCAKCHIKEK